LSILISSDLPVKLLHPEITMGLFTDLTLAKSKTKEGATPVEPVTGVSIDPEKAAGSAAPSEKDNSDVHFTANAQAGVKRIEAATAVWSKWHLVGAYVM
jgi:hypothetical protein